MISKPSRTWTLLSRTLAACLEALEADPMDVGRRWCAPRDRWLGEGP
jgi:hypothetical protein